MNELLFTLEGTPPSKKNDHLIVSSPKTGRHFIIPGKRSQTWEKTAALLLQSQARAFSQARAAMPLSSDVRVQIVFLVKGARKWDLSNKEEIVLDALVRGGILVDDNRFVLIEKRVAWEPSDSDSVSIRLRW